MENNTILIAVCDGSFINNEGKSVNTHRLLLKRESERGIFYEFVKYDAKKVSSDELFDRVDCPVRLFYDKYGRVVAI